MTSRLWYLNADFEVELAAPPGRYQRPIKVAEMNRRLALQLINLASAGDAILVERPWTNELVIKAQNSGIALIDPKTPGDQSTRLFTPWGWTESAIEAGKKAHAIVKPIPLEIVKKVNSKLYSFQLEQELGVAIPGSAVAANITELLAAIARACPDPEDKWVIKSPMGFAARERVLGRGSQLTEQALIWVKRQFQRGEKLIFQRWLNVVREYGVQIIIAEDGKITFNGISDLQTNGAGTGIGYLLGRKIPSERESELRDFANIIGNRLYQEGYYGPAGIDAIEHSKGLHPLLEINARYTMGFVAVAVERAIKPPSPIHWNIRNDKEGLTTEQTE